MCFDVEGGDHENGKRTVEDALAQTQVLDDDYDYDYGASSPPPYGERVFNEREFLPVVVSEIGLVRLLGGGGRGGWGGTLKIFLAQTDCRILMRSFRKIAGGRLMDGHERTQSIDTVEVDNDFLFETELVKEGDNVEAETRLFETELVEEGDHVEAETQVVEDQDCIDHELGGQTQLLEDSDCAAKELDQEFSVSSDAEGTDKTEVLTDADDKFSDDGTTLCKVNDFNCENAAADRVKKTDKELCGPSLHYQCGKDCPVNSDASTDDECIPGSGERSFAIDHKESLHPFGLAAALSRQTSTVLEPNNTVSNSESGKKQESVKVQNPATENKDDGVASLSHPISCEQDQNYINDKCHLTGNKRARTLFNDCIPAGIMNKIDCPTERKDSSQLLVGTRDIAGLSYVGSQEPGEQTQANAWDIVDKFLSFGDVELSGELCPGVDIHEKTPHTSGAKGAQTLAKRSALRSPVNTNGIFDWIDSHEDEGGGEFFSKRKVGLLGSEHHMMKSRTQSQKRKYVDFKRTGDAVDGLREREEGIISGIGQKIIGSTLYGSTPILHSSMRNNEMQFSGPKAKKNILKEMDATTNSEVLGQQVEETASPDGAYDVGINTQLAAEAMEELFCGLHADHDLMDVDPVAKGSTIGSSRGATDIKVPRRASIRKNSHSASDSEERSKKLNKTKRSKVSRKCPNSCGKQSRNTQTKSSGQKHAVKSSLKRVKKFKEHLAELESPNCNECIAEKPSYSHRRGKTGGCGYVSDMKKVDKLASNGLASIDKQLIQGHFHATFSPIASRTRQSKKMNSSDKTEVSKSLSMEESAIEGKRSGSGPMNFPKGRRSHRKKSNNSNHASNLGIVTDGAPEVNGRSSKLAWQKFSKTDDGLSSMSRDTAKRKKTLGDKTMSSSLHLDMPQKPADAASFLSVNGTKNVEDYLCGSFMPFEADKRSSICDINEKTLFTNTTSSASSVPTHSAQTYDIANSNKGIANAERKGALEGLLKRKVQSPQSSCIIPLKDALAVSPICEGDDCQKQSGKKVLPRSSHARELIRLNAPEPERVPFLKDLRKRRDMASVSVLFSHHLGEDIIKQQKKKILVRLGASTASSSLNATHFIADKFLRTRNMLEAMALGKPVVTHLWLESCGQASCLIDEKNYILRDMKKEKEIGFNMPASLVRASHTPLLQGRRVFITPNVKPSRELVADMVKAVQGQVGALGTNLIICLERCDTPAE
ncbi:hypothetical protein ACLOJK_018049 [Asimina triloba]